MASPEVVPHSIDLNSSARTSLWLIALKLQIAAYVISERHIGERTVMSAAAYNIKHKVAKPGTNGYPQLYDIQWRELNPGTMYSHNIIPDGQPFGEGTVRTLRTSINGFSKISNLPQIGAQQPVYKLR